MQSPLHEISAPYKLASNVVYFHDWRYVNPGGFSWIGLDGQDVAMFGTDPAPPMRYEYRDMPLGLELKAVPAHTTEPVIRAEGTEVLLHGGNLLHDGGRYRLWYRCYHLQPGAGESGSYLLRYAESDDGIEWRHPKIGLVEYDGSRDNDIVYGGPNSPDPRFYNGNVFMDPSAPAAEHYKLFYLSRVPRKLFDDSDYDIPVETVVYRRDENLVSALLGAVSPDGLKWSPIPEPLLFQRSDTQNICYYDAATGKYVAYIRSRVFGRRTIGRSESDDFRRFSLPEVVFWPDAMQAPFDTWYYNGKNMMPGTTDYHIMFPTRWSLKDDRFEFDLAASPDGIIWGFVPGGPVRQPGGAGSWDAGLIEPGCGMAYLPDERMGMLAYGSPLPHKHPRRPPLGALGWTWWEKDRLVALKASSDASFALHPLTFDGRSVQLNFRTRPSGFVSVEALGPDGAVLPGRSFSDCDMLSGDQLAHVVSWRGKTDLGHADGSPVILRFRLRTAELFAVRFV